MHATYDAFLARMINKYEGGYGWDKGDPGGPTKYGITCYDLAEHRGQKMNSMAAWAPIVKSMTLAEAEAIYWTKYGKWLRYDDLPAGVDVVMLDYGVNSGRGRPVTVARTLLKQPGPPMVDDALIKRINQSGPTWFIKAMDTERLGFMHRIKNGAAWRQFGGGWGNRVNDLDLYALALAKKAPLPIPVDTTVPPVAKSSSKATHPEPSASKHVGTGLSGALSTALAGHIAGVPMSTILLLVVGAVLAGTAYYLYQRYAAAKVNAVITAVETKPPGPTGSK
jgi:lysozyme family protein